MSTWHEASDPPTMNTELKFVSDRIIIQFNDDYYIIGRYYSGPDGSFYEDQYKELLRGVERWRYLEE